MKKEKHRRDDAFYHGKGRQAMKNNPSDWVTPILERTKKYKDERGKKNEAAPYILQFWTPKTSLADGIKKICDHYKEKK